MDHKYFGSWTRQAMRVLRYALSAEEPFPTRDLEDVCRLKGKTLGGVLSGLKKKGVIIPVGFKKRERRWILSDEYKGHKEEILEALNLMRLDDFSMEYTQC